MDRMPETEDLLRAALRERADVLDPADRLEDVLAAAGAPSGRRWWLSAGAAAAAVAAVVAGAWLVRGPLEDPARTVPAVTATTAPTTAPTPVPSPSGSPSGRGPSPSPSATAPAIESALPVYVVVPEVPGDPGSGYGLARRWVTLAAPDEDATRVRAAVDASLGAPVEGVDPSAWAGVDVSAVTVTTDGVSVEVSAAPRRTGTAADDLALAQVGWTAQAVLGRGNVPVTVTTGGSPLGVVTRPATDQWYTVLTNVWVTAPTPGERLPAGSPVIVSGQASVFEAALTWQLERDGTVVDRGSVTASAGAPAWGDYTIDLGTLPSGGYTIRVRSLSPRDGAVDAEDVVSFTVR